MFDNHRAMQQKGNAMQLLRGDNFSPDDCGPANHHLLWKETKSHHLGEVGL